MSAVRVTTGTRQPSSCWKVTHATYLSTGERSLDEVKVVSRQVEDQDLGRLLPDEGQAILATDRHPVALVELGPVHRDRPPGDVDPRMARWAQPELPTLSPTDRGDPEVHVLVDLEASVPPLLRGEEHEHPAGHVPIEGLLPVSRLQSDHATPAGAVLVLEHALEHVGQDLHVSVAVAAERGAGLHAIIIDHPQGSEPHVRRVVVLAEREGVPAVEPAPVRAAARLGGSKLDHRLISLATAAALVPRRRRFWMIICHEGWHHPESVRWAAVRRARLRDPVPGFCNQPARSGRELFWPTFRRPA